MNLKLRVEKILEYFSKHNPEAKTELQYANSYELLVAVILSAQCTDKRVNLVTPALFQKYPDVFRLSRASSEEIFPLIRSISYPNNKAKHLEGMAKRLVQEFQGILPSDVELLKTLPGVGQKTANVIASVVFNLPAMAVDTHVFRLSSRIGLTRNAKNPSQTEKQLMMIIPKGLVAISHHWIILHGRYVCTARNPKCDVCGISAYCKYFEAKQKVNPSKKTKSKK